MKGLILITALAVAGFANAHELDNESTVAQPAQITAEQAAQLLPKTTVIRVNKNDPSDVQVVHLAKKLAKGEKVEKANFMKVAVNTEIPGIEFDSSNELDATSSTSSWRFGYGGGYGYGAARGYVRGYARGYGRGYYNNSYYRRPYPGYGYGYRPSYGYNYGYGSYYPNYYTINSGCYNSYSCADYYPTYRVAAYTYAASPYYTYADPYYSYYYCAY